MTHDLPSSRGLRLTLVTLPLNTAPVGRPPSISRIVAPLAADATTSMERCLSLMSKS